jgi:hypothetical protein
MLDAFSEQSRDPGVPEGTSATGRALVRLTMSGSAQGPLQTTFRPDARFVVHLIATVTRAPQTRTLRRAAIDDVVTTYADASARDRPPVAANGATLSRVA